VTLGAIPSWVVRWLGVDAPGASRAAGEGTVYDLEFAWPLPPWVTLLVVLALLVMIIVAYRNTDRRVSSRVRGVLAALRLAAVGVLLVMIAQPMVSIKRTGLPTVALLLDTSQSMSMSPGRSDAPLAVPASPGSETPGSETPAGATESATGAETAGSSRWESLLEVLGRGQRSLPRRLRERYMPRVYTLAPEGGAGEVVALEADDSAAANEAIERLSPDVPVTRLGGAVADILRDLRGNDPAALIVLSDGINTDGPTLRDAANAARRRGVPLFTVALGSDEVPVDLALSELLVEEVVFVGDVLTFDATVTASGLRGEEVDVVLRDADSERALAQQSITLPPDGETRSVRLTHRPTETGQRRYTIEVAPRPGEVRTDNNRQIRTVTVSDQRIRVLLVQDYPNFEFRYLWNMLTRTDHGIELDAVLQQADPRLLRAVRPGSSDAVASPTTGATSPVGLADDSIGPRLRAFPVQRDDLFSYDVIILGDVNPALLSPTMLADLAAFVDPTGVDQEPSLRPDTGDSARPREAKRGGALMLLAGPRFMPVAYTGTPLERIMPCDPPRVRIPPTDQPLTEPLYVIPTPIGRASPPMQLGADADASQQIWADLPPIFWLARLGTLKPGVRILAIAQSGQPAPTPGVAGNGQSVGPAGPTNLQPSALGPPPCICLHYVGAGKVLMHATDETWRWRRRAGDRYFERYWVQMLRFLARGKLLDDGEATLSTDRRRYERGEPVQLRALFSNPDGGPSGDTVTVALRRGDETPRRVLLSRDDARRGVFETVLSELDVGAYRAWLTEPNSFDPAPSVDFAVLVPGGELTSTQTDVRAMRRAAELTGGRFYRYDTSADDARPPTERLLEELPRGRHVPIEALPPRPLWNRWPVILLLVILLGTEWLIRKRAALA